MNKFLLLVLVVSSTSLFAAEEKSTVTDPSATPSISYDVSGDKKFNHRESHWLMTIGAEGMKYPVPFNFVGAEEKFKPKDQELWGGRLGLGGSIYLGAGVNTTTKVEGYYMGILNGKTENAGPQVEAVDFAYVKRTGQIWGAEASQSLGYIFDFKTHDIMGDLTYMTVEPFVEAGIGWGKANNRVNYHYDTGSSGVQENYKLAVEDQLLNAKVGGGVNFTANNGFFFFLKATVNRFDLQKRETKGYSQPNGSGTTPLTGSEKDVKIDPITVYSLGGGYKF